jgi:uncharacterized protein
MERTRLSATKWGEQILLALLFTAIGLLIIVTFSPWYPPLGRVPDYVGRLALLALLLVAAAPAPWLLPPGARASRYVPLARGLFTLMLVVTLDRITGIYLLTFLGVSDAVPAGWALQKLDEALVVFATVIACTLAFGQSPGSVYLQRGYLRYGLTVGLVAFAVAAAGAIPTAGLLFGAPGLTPARVVPWLPWLLIYVLANGALEELMFRGLFLRKLEPFFGPLASNLLVAVVFTVLHRGAFYAPDQYLFLAIVFPAALVWGWLMQKSESIWGSILFHAGMDIPIVLGIFANL